MLETTGRRVEVTPQLIEWFNSRWSNDLGAIDGKDASFLAALLRDNQPRNVVEIGCASGFSLSVLAGLLQQSGPAQINSFDILDRFYADRNKPVGYLLAEAVPHANVAITIRPNTMSLDVMDHVHEPIDLCFIDAAHKHPWPLLDTLAVLPRMKPGGVIVHHDLQMFRDARALATGPKVLLDQIPDHLRIIASHQYPVPGGASLLARRVDDNIFALRVPNDRKRLGIALSDGFFLSWDKGVVVRISETVRQRFREFAERHYGAPVVRAFDNGLERSAVA